MAEDLATLAERLRSSLANAVPAPNVPLVVAQDEALAAAPPLPAKRQRAGRRPVGASPHVTAQKARLLRKLKRIARCNGPHFAVDWAARHKGASRLLGQAGVPKEAR